MILGPVWLIVVFFGDAFERKEGLSTKGTRASQADNHEGWNAQCQDKRAAVGLRVFVNGVGVLFVVM